MFYLLVPENPNNIMGKIAAVRSLNANDKEIFEFAYRAMGILTSLSSSMLRIDSIFVATVGILISSETIRNILLKELIPFSLIPASLLLSILLSLYVISIEWLFLGKVREGTERQSNGENITIHDFTNEISSLIKTLHIRSYAFLFSWMFTLFSVILSVGLILAIWAGSLWPWWISLLIAVLFNILFFLNFRR